MIFSSMTISRWILALALVAAIASLDSPALAVVHIRQPIEIPMRDGMTLAADVYLPAEEGSWPVVLIQTPYAKDLLSLVFLLELTADPLLKNPNYAFVVLDWRGFFHSADAAYLGSPTYGQDGHDAVEWIAVQPWCNGNVGTWGASALGRVQLQTAAQRPPALKACVPIVYHLEEWYDLNYPGGVYYKNRNSFIDDYFGFSLARDHPIYDFFWTLSEAFTGDPSQMDVPMLHVSGWFDHEPRQTMRAHNAINSKAHPGAVGRQWLLVGPWSHSHLDQTNQGELQYPDAQYGSSIRAVEFFDFYLRGIENNWEARPKVEFYLLNQGWRFAAEWPPADAAERIFYLAPEGTLADAAPTPGGFADLASNPADPAPVIYGAVLSPSSAQGPGDVSALLARDDCRGFMREPLAAPLRIEGEVRGTIWIECDAVDADVALRLVQIDPNGRWISLADGIRRASLRNGYTTREFLQPGTAYEIPVEIAPIAVAIPAGHRLGVIVAPTIYDLYDVNPHDGSSFSDEEGVVLTPATIRVLMDPAHPSRLAAPAVAEKGMSGVAIR